MAGANLEMLKTAAVKLRPVIGELVFIGGSITELFITDEASTNIRETKDVDVIVETLTYSGYLDFTERLKGLGFSEDTRKGAPICRWVNEETTLDVMPVSEQILGFTNKWYQSAFINFQIIEIAKDIEIKILKPEYFIGTKIEAFKSRGEGDYYASHDLEDIIAVIDGRPEFLDELGQADADIKLEIAQFIEDCLHNESFINALPGHLSPVISAQGRLGIVLDRLKRLGKI